MRKELTIASVDAINMYHSIKLATTKKAVRFFARTFTLATKKTINLCLELIRFEMSSNLICFAAVVIVILAVEADQVGAHSKTDELQA